MLKENYLKVSEIAAVTFDCFSFLFFENVFHQVKANTLNFNDTTTLQKFNSLLSNNAREKSTRITYIRGTAFIHGFEFPGN